MVTSKNAGLAVPDWPTTFGYNMFMFPISKWIGGIFFEHTHRLIASVVGFLTIVLAIWLWRADDRRWLRSLGWIALGLVVLQGILGGLRVTMMRDQIGVFHACVAQAFLGLLVFIALVRTNLWKGLTNAPVDLAPLRAIVLATTAAIYLQLALGATMRHQHRDLSILDFPTANGAWLPDTSDATLAKINDWRDRRGLSDVNAFQIWLQMAHRFMAVLIAIGVIATFLCSRETPARRLSILWLIGIFIQVTLGAFVIWSNKAADIATTHVAVGAIMLSLGVCLCAIVVRLSPERIRSTSSPATAIA